MPKKSKKDEPCFTRTNKSGGKYITCEGAQKRNKKLAKEIKTLTADTPKAKPKQDKLKIPANRGQGESVKKLNNLLTGFYKDKITKRAESIIKALIRKSKSYDDKKPYVINVSGVFADGRIEYVVLNETQNKYQDKTLFLGPKAKPSKGELPEEKPKGVAVSQKKKDMMDMISEYMSETGQIPKNANDPSFVKWLKSKDKAKPKAKPKPKAKVETPEEAYKRHFKEYNNPKKYPDKKLKGFLENLKERPKSYYINNKSLENSDKGALKAITNILRIRNQKDYRIVDPSLFKPQKGDLVLKS